MTKPYFQVAQPLSKEDFLTVYKESILLIQLIFAPFGITESSLNVIGDEEKVTEMYSTVFQQYEDIVSKRLFKMKGYDDDRIIASMHKYVGESHDSDIINELKIASQALKQMIVSSNVVEFDFPINEQHNIINSFTASLLLDKVLTALKPLLYGVGHEIINGEIFIDGVNLYMEDIFISKILPIHIPIRTFSPICSFSRMPFREISLQSIDSIQSLLTSLTLSVDEILSYNNDDINYQFNGESCNRLISFSLQQYHCLLDLFGGDPLVQKVIAKHMNYDSNGHVIQTTIQDVRDGAILNSLNLSTQPSILFVSQLEQQLQRLTNRKAILESNGDDNENDLNKLVSNMENIETSLRLVQTSLKLREEAHSAAMIGDFNTAIMLVSEELLDYLDSDSSDDDDDDEVIEKIVKPKQILPTYLKVASLIERASYFLENGDLQLALEDCTCAIKLDNQCSKAYSMRSQISLQLIQQSNLEDDLSDIDDDDDDDDDKNLNTRKTKQMLELQKAAEDALLAFLLDGSSDLSLASAAEEAAREACRMTAKEVFYSRRNSKENNNIDFAIINNIVNNYPRSWFVGSYFAAYEQISIALSIYQPSTYFNKQIMKYKMKTSCLDNNEVNKMQDIDMDQSNTFFSSCFFEVPSFLWNVINVSHDSEHSIEEKNNDPNDHQHQHLFEYSQCKRDREGYALLICLSELIEAVTYDEFIFANKQKQLESTKSDEHYEHVIEPMTEDSSDAYNFFTDINQSKKDLISEGKCQCTCENVEILHSNKLFITSNEVIPACKYYITLLELLRGENTSPVDGSSSTASVLESFPFLKELRLLNKESIEELTGVVFASNGSIESILEYPFPAQIIFNDEAECTSNSENNNKKKNKTKNLIDDNNIEDEEDDEDGWETCDESGDDDEKSSNNSSNKSEEEEKLVIDPIKEIEIALSKVNATIFTETSKSFDFNNISNTTTTTTLQSIPNLGKSEFKKSYHEDCANAINKDNQIIIPISHRLRARLLNMCGSFAYLAGDAIGAVKCFRTSIEQDPFLIDSQLKLGSLLVDMDELEEASKILSALSSKDSNNMVILLHLAELATHENQFDVAIKHLRQARKLSEEECNKMQDNNHSTSNIRDIANLRSRLFVNSMSDLSTNKCSTIDHYKQRVEMSGYEMSSSIHSLLGINLFRQSPQHPEIALYTLQSALNKLNDSNSVHDNNTTTDVHGVTQKESPILLLCCGEVYSQLGDMVNALKCFRKANELAPENPLCYVNAARTYQQLSQLTTSEQHLQAALKLDPALAMVRVDLAQNLLLSGKASSALSLLQEALDLARQVSEIRDVLTAQMIAHIQIDLEVRGLYFSPYTQLLDT